MSAGGTTKPDTAPQANGGYSAAPSPPGFLPGPPPAPPAYPRPAAYSPRPRRFRGVLAGLGIVVAIALAAAALVVSLTNTHETPAAQPAPPPTADADRALCEAIAPLIKEDSERGKAFVALGHTGTPERDAGIPAYVTATTDWVKRAQAVLDQNTSLPPGYLLRSLQRYVDDERAYVASLRPGPATDADNAAWNDSLVALSGPYEVCNGLGVPLW